MAKLDNAIVAAAFDKYGQAEIAIDELEHEGFAKEQIGIAIAGKQLTEPQTPIDELEESGAEGAVAGAVTGGAAGAVAGALVTLLVPGIGTVLAGGLLAGIAMGAAAGAAAGGYIGPFVALGISEKDARTYEKELKRGRTIVVIKAGDRSAKARNILHGHGGVDSSSGGNPPPKT